MVSLLRGLIDGFGRPCTRGTLQLASLCRLMCVTLSWRVGPPVGVTATTSLILESSTSTGSANSHLLAMLGLHLALESGIPSYDATDDIPRPAAVRSWPSRRVEFHGDDAWGRVRRGRDGVRTRRTEKKRSDVPSSSIVSSFRVETRARVRGYEALDTAAHTLVAHPLSPPRRAHLARNGSDDRGSSGAVHARMQVDRQTRRSG